MRTPTNPAISEEARAFLDRRPVRIITSARIIFFINILLILVSLWCIKYPDTIKSSMIINAAGQGEMRISSKEPIVIRRGQKVRITWYRKGADGPQYEEGMVNRVIQGATGKEDRQILIDIAQPCVECPAEGCILTEDRRLLSRLLASLDLHQGSR